MLHSEQFIEIKASGDLPSPRGPALKVIQLCKRENVPLPEITHVLQIDPAMVGRILKLANSAAYSRPRPAVALTPDVLMSIGIQTVRQVVLAFSLVTGNRNGQCAEFDYLVFWSRSAATGVAAQLLGAATRAAPPADLFTVGLLANVGRLALAALHPAEYGKLLARVGSQFSTSIIALESEVFGYNHNDISAAMMNDWGLPRLFCDAVLFHESPELSGFDADSRSAKLVNCVHLGARMADLCFMPDNERAAEFGRLLPLAQNLGIAADNFKALSDQMLGEWTEWGALLEIPVHRVAPFSTLTVAQAQSDAGQTGPEAVEILVVDDDPTVCLVLQKLLVAAGHTVHVARNESEALSLALSTRPQLVITDVHMAQHDGSTLIGKLRQSSSGSAMYIIALGIPGDSEIAQALDRGADDFLAKPVDGALLRARVKVGMRVVGKLSHLHGRDPAENLPGAVRTGVAR